MTRTTVLRRTAGAGLLLATAVTLVASTSLWSVAGVAGLQGLGSWLTTPMKAITFLGDERFYLVIIPLIFWCISKETGADLGVLLAASGVLNGVLKSFFKHQRPFWENSALELGDATSFSLPSGHAQNSATLLGFLAQITPGRGAWLRFAWPALMVLLAVLVCVSRVYLGVHFPGDVIWGAALGLLLLVAYGWLKPRLKPWLAARSMRAHVILAVLAAMVVLALNFAMESVPFGAASRFATLYPDALRTTMEDAATMAGMVFGLWAGLAFEAHFVRFSVAGPLWQRAVRFVVGIAVLLAIWMGLKVIFPAEPVALGLALRTLRYALSVLWAIVGWPWLFVRIGLGKGEAHGKPAVRAAV